MVLVVLVSLGGVAWAGEYYLSDNDAYWWYWDGQPNYEVLIPSAAFAYVQLDWGGTSSLEVALDQDGPLLIIGTLPGTDVNRAWNALSARYSAAVTNARTTTDSTIETEMGLQARFKVLEGSSQGGPDALVRMVAFVRDGRTAFLMFVGNKRDYAGNAQQYWLRAVHSFNWRS